MLPLLVASTSFAPDTHTCASFSASGPAPTSHGYQKPAVWEPSALISSLAHSDEEESSIFPEGSPFVFPVPNTTATLSSSTFPPQSGDDVIYRRGPTTVESTLPPSPGPASAVKYADVPFTHSSGMAELDIPIYTLRGMELEIGLKEGMKATSSEILGYGEQFLGKGYKEVSPGRFVSADGKRVFRIRDSDLIGHRGGPLMLILRLWFLIQ